MHFLLQFALQKSSCTWMIKLFANQFTVCLTVFFCLFALKGHDVKCSSITADL